MNKNLIVYFCGNNKNIKKIALEVHQMIESTLFEVETIYDYPKDDHSCQKQAKDELNKHLRPKIIDYVHRFEDYGTIILVYPDWCSTLPMALFTFLEIHPFTTQRLIPICIGKRNHGKEDIKKMYPRLKIEEGLEIENINEIEIIKDYFINLI